MAHPVLKLPLTLLATLVGLLGPATSLAAPEPSPSEISIARRLFAEGRAAEDAARWREAAEKFRGAIAIKDTPGLRFHLARCEEEQGAFVEALVEYDRARELLDSGIKAPDVEKLLAAARERVRGKVALLTLKLPPDVQNVSVELDGKTLSRSVLGQPMPINPGKHRLTAVAVGRSRFSGELELGTGEVRQLALELPPEPITREPPFAAAVAPAPSPPARRADARKPSDDALSTRTLLLVGEGGLFVAGLATGIGFSLAKSSAEETYAERSRTVGDAPNACTKPDRPVVACNELNQALEDRDRDAMLATLGFVGAGVSAAAFGLTYFLWPDGKTSADVHARASRDGWSLALSGRF